MLPVEEINILNKLRTEAESLLNELDAYYERDGDLMRWYYSKHKEQYMVK